MNFQIITKKLFFYWVTSFVLATFFYYLLWIIMPKHYVFGTLFKMFLYHKEHPIMFIAIPCFFYGIIATAVSDKFSNHKPIEQVYFTIIIILFTIICSSPFGGMLWYFYDMKAGYFPAKWVLKMIQNGFISGLEIGWLVIGLSFPYNIIGAIICYFLTKKGSRLFRIKSN